MDIIVVSTWQPIICKKESGDLFAIQNVNRIQSFVLFVLVGSYL